MMTDRWTDRLSAYLDDEMGREERAALEAHLHECAACTATLADLRRIVVRARSLEPKAPGQDLWAGILERIETGPDVVPIGVLHETRARRLSFTMPQLAAAAVTLLLTGAIGARVVIRSPDPSPVVATTDAPAGTADDGVLVGYPAEPNVEERVRQLEGTLDMARGRLDTETVAVIEKNLAIVEAAVREAETALARDPANDYLRAHLERTLRTKLDVLERATLLAET